MNSFFSRVAEIAILNDYPFLHWVVFDTLGLILLKFFLEIFIDEIDSLIVIKNIEKKESIKMLFFSVVILIGIFYILLKLCINKSSGNLLYVAIFSTILTAYIFIKTIYNCVKASKWQKNKPKLKTKSISSNITINKRKSNKRVKTK
ncbi:hypothetical protein U5B43_10160 [Campylobacter sp. 9BO]|uniref:hypothetical protein n=1 Tax=Campylobacter sp. 9BO TaxID=3424759 RepID=UPI003D34800F